MPEEVVAEAGRISDALDDEDGALIAGDSTTAAKQHHLAQTYALAHKTQCIALQAAAEGPAEQTLQRLVRQLKHEAKALHQQP